MSIRDAYELCGSDRWQDRVREAWEIILYIHRSLMMMDLEIEA